MDQLSERVPEGIIHIATQSVGKVSIGNHMEN